MAIEWCKHVDGITIFPKLPVYLRNHHTQWTKNRRVKDAIERNAAAMAQLDAMVAAAAAAASEAGWGGSGGSDGGDGDGEGSGMMEYDHTGDDAGDDAGSELGIGAGGGGSGMSIAQHAPMPQNMGAFPSNLYMVGGAMIGLSRKRAAPGPARGNGERGKDKKKRAPRSCRHCRDVLKRGSEAAVECPGSAPWGKCPYK